MKYKRYDIYQIRDILNMKYMRDSACDLSANI